jgi:hypothetical protein
MVSLFDTLTVACFLGLVIVFFLFSERDTPTLLRCALAGIGLATANQLGNQGHYALGAILIMAAIGLGWVSIPWPGRGR